MLSPTTAERTEARTFLKARPLSRRLGICSKTIARWGAAGKIPRYKINSRVVLFDVREVETFIESVRVAVANCAVATGGDPGCQPSEPEAETGPAP